MKLTPLLLTLGFCAAPLAQAAPDNPLNGWIGQVCYSNGTGHTIIDYQSYNGCAVRLNDAIADPPFGATVTSVNTCTLRSSSTPLPWCSVREPFGIEVEDGDVRPVYEFQRQLEDLRRRHGIDDYERKLLELQSRR
ncbi:MAG: hypothetical protein DI564_01375 [Rhodanobacter denitrificans]|uniref:Uncharacterized protein n=1 Tax=Rhodanobacter denitrificans TaxID=666685 RepID=A0A2W5KQJ5_9GAMM|nr:MAG: hypothetical protein DI564_01375 [Rhodanobacter denitrificans]